jgi:hypothetical protein
VSTVLNPQHSFAQIQACISCEDIGEIEIFLSNERLATTQVDE